MIASLCHVCQFQRHVVSGKGSRFILCTRSLQKGTGERFAKYPVQPKIQCIGFQPAQGASVREYRPATPDEPKPNR